MSRIRLVPIVLVAIVSLAILFGGWQFYQRYSVVKPLQTDLRTIKGVKSLDVQPGNPNAINVTLGTVEILKKAQQELHGPVTISVSGNSNSALKKEYEDIQPTLMEGVAKGNFTEMIAKVTQMSKDKGIQARVTMDSQDIFVQMSKGKNHLYSILPYNLQGGGGVS
jgi:uncharacterized membrane protein (UPF0136 family)